MLKIFSKVANALKAEADAAEAPVWMRDPLSHPDIKAMDSRSLGDLPFGLFRPLNPVAEPRPRTCRPA